MVNLIKGKLTSITAGGYSQIAVPAYIIGGFVSNPYYAADQETPLAEPLFLSLVGPSETQESSTTIPLWPGNTYYITSQSTRPIYVSAETTRHAFSVVLYSSTPSYPPTPIVGPFPPSGPTTMTAVIPSYLYQQYSDDDTLQAFVAAYNSIAQDYIDTLNDLNLPIYTNCNISGGLLDWVGAGLYGYPRPTLSSFQTVGVGEFNTYEFNTTELNQRKNLYNSNIAVTTDDTYKRLLTWHFYKGDGKYFTIPWLKRRIMRFLIGTNGTAPNIDQTYQISVTFGSAHTIAIRFVDFTLEVLMTTQFNAFQFNTSQFNELVTMKVPLTPLPYRQIFQEAVYSGALELPFQYTWVVYT